MSGSPLVFVWRVTEACSLECRFCAFARDMPGPRAGVDPAEVLRIGRLLADFGRREGRPVLVSWLGGEPFGWRPVADLSRRLHDLGLGLGATTNGVPLLAPALRALVAETFDEVTFSVDGLAPWNDMVRVAPGLFDRLRATITAVREAASEAPRRRRLLIKVNTILMRQSVSTFEALCEALQTFGVDEVTFNQLGGNDRPEFYPAHRLLPDEVDAFMAGFADLASRLSACGLRVHGGARYLDRLRATSRGERIPVDDCGPGRWFLFADAQGRVAPCSFTPAQYGVPLAELCTIDDLLALPARFVALRAARRAEACGDCHSTQVFDKFAQSTERGAASGIAP